MVRRLAAVAVLALSLGIAGCGSDTPSTSGGTSAATGAGGGGDAVAWAEKVCSTVAPEREAFSKVPNIDPTDPVKARDGMVAYLDDLVKALERMVSGIQSAGSPPVADGETAAKRVVDTLEEAKATVSTAKDNLAKVDVTDPAAFQAGFTQVGTDLQKLGEMEDPTKGLRGNRELNEAFEKAASCKALQDPGGATPTS
ncbi:hypothetical protein [Alloactinosynnema sp. L-07]|uniref:hypothetical protein n=1 Tax=Alloactinosynnema sp. L-07 TaxID=1653480 RepID=UPI00065F0A18|nr:hypothetical protein [Alloactinosynnema sp. L-07]CRK61085.1 hypothetical protein [Alloactinosynnema sp. L-07]